ncbi:MAG: hypothetical protein Q9225_004307 [Loekoesia sp. 1 TL-2023]
MSDYSSYITYGPDTNCTPALCPASLSVYQYRPTLGGNIAFLILFGVAMIVHILMGLRWRTWFFVFCMFWGCVDEMIGYGGRIMLWENPILYLGPQHARFQPKLYYYIFIPCDILSLILQAVGGALSSTSSGGSKTAVDVSIAGLSFQVFTLCVFIALALEYAYRWYKARRATPQVTPLSRSFKVMVLVAVYCLMVAHPGPVFADLDDEKALQSARVESDLERRKEAM